jgi:methionine--tRNA ligase beta chain
MSEQVSYRDFKKLDIRIGTVKECAKVKGSDKLYTLHVDMGDEVRQIVTGLVDYYTLEELTGKRIAVVMNLKPAKIFGQMSYGMLLAAETKEGDLALITTDNPIADGARIT